MIIEIEREEDDFWINEVPELPGVMVYGQSREAVICWPARTPALPGGYQSVLRFGRRRL